MILIAKYFDRDSYILVTSSLFLGPFVDGEFQRARISSIHRNKQPYRAVYAGHSASVVLDMEFDDLIRKGMVLLCPMAKPEATFHFSVSFSKAFFKFGLSLLVLLILAF